MMAGCGLPRTSPRALFFNSCWSATVAELGISGRSDGCHPVRHIERRSHAHLSLRGSRQRAPRSRRGIDHRISRAPSLKIDPSETRKRPFVYDLIVFESRRYELTIIPRL